MPMMTSYILKFWTHEKRKNLNILRTKHNFSSKKKNFNSLDIKSCTMRENYLLADVTFKESKTRESIERSKNVNKLVLSAIFKT